MKDLSIQHPKKNESIQLGDKMYYNLTSICLVTSWMSCAPDIQDGFSKKAEAYPMTSGNYPWKC